MRLSEVPENKAVVVSNIEGDTRFLTRSSPLLDNYDYFHYNKLNNVQYIVQGEMNEKIRSS